MEFLAVLIQTVVKMLIIAVVAVLGVGAGKALRDRKDRKAAAKQDTQ